MRVGLKPTLIVHFSPGARVLFWQSWLTIEKSSRVVLPPSSARADSVGALFVKTSGASPMLVIGIAVTLLAAAVPAGTDVNCGMLNEGTGPGRRSGPRRTCPRS